MWIFLNTTSVQNQARLTTVNKWQSCNDRPSVDWKLFVHIAVLYDRLDTGVAMLLLHHMFLVNFFPDKWLSECTKKAGLVKIVGSR